MASSPLEKGAGSLAPGALVAGKFRVIGALGEGGMAIVLAAHHEALDMRVALKVMKPDASRKSEVRARFAREARAVASLKSEHVARVLDVGETDDGRPFMVIEHLEGRDLEQLLCEEGPLAVERAVDLALMACIGLADAHARGIVHRDVKPANLFVARELGAETIKLLDFGISKVVTMGADSISTTTEIVGSPAYMSPEQLRSSRRIDGRTDVWSLGTVLFELLCGAPPFGGLSTDLYAVVSSILHDGTPSLRMRRPDVPEPLEAILSRALEKDPDKRTASVIELANALAAHGSARARSLAARAAAAGRSIPPEPSSGTAVVDDDQAKKRADSTAATVYVPTPIRGIRVSALRPTALAATKCASAVSSAVDTVRAAREATTAALASLEGRRVALAFVFASSRHDVSRAASEVGSLTHGASVISCSTAGEMTERGIGKSSLVVLLVCDEGMQAFVTFAENVDADPLAAAAKLCAGFDVAALSARHEGRSQSTTIALIDGLSPHGETIVEGLLRHTRGYQRLVGGAAADDGAFVETQVATRDRSVRRGGAVAAHVFSDKAWGIGVAHGLAPSTQRMRVTRSMGNRIFEIERRPAFDVYREYAQTRFGMDLTADRAAPFLMAHELGIYHFDHVRHARAGLRVESDGSIVCAGSVPEYASVCILTGDPEEMVNAARKAALEAKEQIQGKAAGVLVFDCVCRESMLGARFDREMSAICEVFPGVPTAGFLTYGEIARARGRLEGGHNGTVVVVAIPS